MPALSISLPQKTYDKLLKLAGDKGLSRAVAEIIDAAPAPQEGEDNDSQRDGGDT